MVGYIILLCILISVAILAFFILYLYQARWRTSTLPDLTSHAVKLMTAYDTNREESIFPVAKEKKWKHTINNMEDACVRDQKTYEAIKLSFPSRTKRSIVNVHAELPAEHERMGRTVILYVNGSFTGFFAGNPKIRRTIHRSGPFALQLPLNVMFHEVLPSERYIMVGFDWPTNSPLHLNFGQKYDIEVLNYLYASLVSELGQEKIVIMADCLGALKLLNWMGKQDRDVLERRLHAIILISPITCLDDFLHQLTNVKLVNAVVPSIVRSGCGNYTKESSYEDWFVHKPWTAFPQVPLFIATVKDDTISTAQHHVPIILEKFPNSRVTLFENEETVVGTRKIKHGMLNHVPTFRDALQTFLKQEIVQ